MNEGIVHGTFMQYAPGGEWTAGEVYATREEACAAAAEWAAGGDGRRFCLAIGMVATHGGGFDQGKACARIVEALNRYPDPDVVGAGGPDGG